MPSTSPSLPPVCQPWIRFEWPIPLDSIERVGVRCRNRRLLILSTKWHRRTGQSWAFRHSDCHNSTRWPAPGDPNWKRIRLYFVWSTQFRVCGLPVPVNSPISRLRLPPDSQRSALAMRTWFYPWCRFRYLVEWCTSAQHLRFDLAEATFCGGEKRI